MQIIDLHLTNIIVTLKFPEPPQVILPNIYFYIWLIFCNFIEHAHPLHRVMTQG